MSTFHKVLHIPQPLQKSGPGLNLIQICEINSMACSFTFEMKLFWT